MSRVEGRQETFSPGAGSRDSLSRYLRNFLLLMPMIALPFFYGGVVRSFWSAAAGVFLAGAAVLVLLEKDLFALKRPARKWLLVIALILVFPLIQLLPLPASWICVVSPQRWMWLHRAREVTGLSGWTSLSYVPLSTLSMWLWWICLAGYGLLLERTIESSEDFTWFFNALFFLAGFEALYGLFQVLIPSSGVFGVDVGDGPAACGTFMNRDNYAALLGMIWPLLMARLLSLDIWQGREKSSRFDTALRGQIRQKQFFLALILGLVMLSLFFTQSRGGIVCFFVVLTVFVSFGPLARQPWMRFLVAVPWIVMVVYGGYLGFGAIVNRFERLGHDAQGRIEIWRDSWELIRGNPLFGTGLDSYEPVIFLYQKNDFDQVQIGDAHNDYLQLAADMGLPFGAAATLLIWGYWWFTAIDLARRKRAAASRPGAVNPRDPPLGRSRTLPRGAGPDRHNLINLGALAGMAGFLCHSWVDFNWQIPANQVYFIIVLVLMRSSVRFCPPSLHGNQASHEFSLPGPDRSKP